MKRFLSLSLAIMMFILFASGSVPLHISAQTPENRVVRVAYPIQAGLTDHDEYGNYCGYTYEYLQEIAQYTGWDYEFVEIPGSLDQSLTTMMQMLKDGEIDLMGAMMYSEALGQEYDYSSHSYGSSQTVLQVLYDNVETDVINSQADQSFRVAVLATASRSIKELEDYFSMNMTTAQYVLCDSVEEQVQALKDGRADMMLNSSMNPLEGVRTIASFASKPFYFVTTKGSNSGILAELNTAMVHIEQSDPYFSTALYNKYFAPANDQLFLSETEKDFIAEAGTLKVGILTHHPPYQQYDGEGNTNGISAGLLAYISARTGLNFTYVPASTQQQLYTMAENGEIDLVAGIQYDYDLAKQYHLSMTQPYVSSQYYLMMKESSDESLNGKRLALVNIDVNTSHDVYPGEIVPYDTVFACIEAVDRGEADYTYVDIYTAQYYLNDPEFRNLKLIPQTYELHKISLGIVKPGHQQLLSICNKVIACIPETDMQAIVNANTIKQRDFSLGVLIREYPIQSVSVIVCIFALIILLLLLLIVQKVRASRKTALELRKHFRVYALVNEYFFEYDFRKNEALISSPLKDDDKLHIEKYDYHDTLDDPLRQSSREQFLDVISSKKDGVYELYLYCTDHAYHWLRIALENVYDGDTPAYAIGRINVIDEEKSQSAKLQEKAQLDSLTHIYNAESSHHLIEQEIARLGKEEKGALIILDIDHFKRINDTYGHMAGDDALIRVAALLQENFRKDDIVGRPGGDEFIVYLKRVPDAQMLAEKCCRLCERIHDIKLEDDQHLTISAGVAMANADTRYEALFRQADKALYQAKALGRDQFFLAQEAIPTGDAR